MACCQTPAPPQDRTPSPTRVSDDHSVTWGLATIGSEFDAAARAEVRHDATRLGLSLGGIESLLQLSVRLNV